MAFQEPTALRLTITIADIEPAIWRRVVVPRALNFAQLHEVIQAAFDWTDSHLHHFIVGGLVIGAPEFDEDGFNEYTTLEATEIKLTDLLIRYDEKLRIRYEYDFGDSWRHEIEIEELAPADTPAGPLPICIAGARHRPPEDVGGPNGYFEFLEAWHDKTHVDHKALRRWVGRAFDPEKFDAAKATRDIARALKRCSGGYRFRLDP
ncbi:MAG: plasmid pRiA4b ORF-3 family protein [Alphaproteobacteria bacterium]|nr:plasmid pRiA4b ORF-3 family protein [Alphaproteobacteria bacterium]